MQKIGKRTRVKIPSGQSVWQRKKERVGFARCSNCGGKLNTARLNLSSVRSLPKSQHRISRPYPNLCSRCMREQFKAMVRVS